MLPDSIAIRPPLFDLWSALGIGGIAVVIAVAWVWIYGLGQKPRMLRVAIAAALLMALSAGLAHAGVMARFDIRPPPMMLMMPCIFALAFWMGLSSFGREAAESIPLATLVGLQAFRLPLELVMHRAGTLGIMPMELSYSGYNWDILTGAGALALWLWFRTGREMPRLFVWLWGLWGSYCLLAIAAIALTTSPMLRLFGDQPRHLNTWVLYFPYIWLPVVLVTVAMASHILIWCKLLGENTYDGHAIPNPQQSSK